MWVFLVKLLIVGIVSLPLTFVALFFLIGLTIYSVRDPYDGAHETVARFRNWEGRWVKIILSRMEDPNVTSDREFLKNKTRKK